MNIVHYRDEGASSPQKSWVLGGAALAGVMSVSAAM
jgi:uncharacterized protein involved in exopolysaccharide biosynthesis